MVVNLSQQYSLLSDWVGELRDVEVQGDRMRFRRNLENRRKRSQPNPQGKPPGKA